MGKNLKGRELGPGFSQRKNGLYQARYKDRFGKQHTLYSRSLPELRANYANAVAQNVNYTSIRCDVVMDDWFKQWMIKYKEKSIRASTKTTYTHVYYKNISPLIGLRKINTLVRSDIQLVIDVAAEAGYTYERQSKIKIILNDLLNCALNDDLISKNPCAGVVLRAKKKHKIRFLSKEEQDVFFTYCKGTFYENLFYVAINTGLRSGELFALTKDDINLDEGYISVTKSLGYQKLLGEKHKTFHLGPPKTEKSNRKVPINSVCREYLLKQFDLKEVVSEKRPKQECDFLFVTKYNTPLNTMIYSDAIRSVVRMINCTRSLNNQFDTFSGHTFRHTFATRCFERGIDPKVVQMYLGHATLSMTMDIYTHVSEDVLSRDIERINE